MISRDSISVTLSYPLVVKCYPYIQRNLKEFKETCTKNHITFASDVELSYLHDYLNDLLR